MYFDTKSYLKSNRNHTVKHTLKLEKQRFDSLEIVLLLDYNIKNHSYIAVQFH